MKKYSLIIFLIFFSAQAFINHRETNLLDNKLTVVFVYCAPDKKDREAKKELQKLMRAFDKFKESSHYRNIGIAWMKVNLLEDSEFKDIYLRKIECSNYPKILFFERAYLFEEETLEVTSLEDITSLLAGILSDREMHVGKLVHDLEKDHKEEQRELKKAQAASAYSFMYAPYSALDYYNGYYSPYHGSYGHFGWGIGWSHGRYRY